MLSYFKSQSELAHGNIDSTLRRNEKQKHGRSLSLPLRNIPFLAGPLRLAGTRLRVFQISFLQASKALKLKTVLSVKTQV